MRQAHFEDCVGEPGDVYLSEGAFMILDDSSCRARRFGHGGVSQQARPTMEAVLPFCTLGAGRRASRRAFDRVSLSIIAKNKLFESRGRPTEMMSELYGT